MELSRAGKSGENSAFFTFVVVTFLIFLVRDGMTGLIRYVLLISGLNVLWFIPDLMSFAVIIFFMYQQVFLRKNVVGILFVLNFFFSLIIGSIFMDLDATTFLSALKSMTSIFVGFAFYNRSVCEVRWARNTITIVMIASLVGILANPYYEYPWVGLETSAFGVERVASRLWWSGGEVRYGGFAGDSTMAAYVALFSFVLVRPYLNRLVQLAIWPLLFWAILVTTSKTALGVAAVYLGLSVLQWLIRSRGATLELLQFGARASFALILVPIILMLAVGGVDLTTISPDLASLSDRIDNTWSGPFAVLADVFPLGLIIGCGVGCYAYPMTYSALANLYFPLDNFYLTTYVMLGFPFAIFVLVQVYCVKFCEDLVKLNLIILLNIYAITVQCYGPSFATLMMGYMISASFAPKWKHAYLRAPRSLNLPLRSRAA